MPKKKNTVYLVLGVMNTGSASLTYPEDFEMIGVFDNKNDADKKVWELNLAVVKGDMETDDESGDEYVDGDDPTEYMDEIGVGDYMMYHVWDVENFLKKK